MRWQSRRPRTRWISLSAGLRAACCSSSGPLCAQTGRRSCRQILPAAFRRRHWKHCLPRVTLRTGSCFRHPSLRRGRRCSGQFAPAYADQRKRSRRTTLQIRIYDPAAVLLYGQCGDDRDRRYDRLSAWPSQQILASVRQPGMPLDEANKNRLTKNIFL